MPDFAMVPHLGHADPIAAAAAVVVVVPAGVCMKGMVDDTKRKSAMAVTAWCE